MDKYHIYQEVGAGRNSQVFKGREKMNIEYVAIKRVDKSMMSRVVNEVQVCLELTGCYGGALLRIRDHIRPL